MPTLNIDGIGKVKVEDSFLSLPPDEQAKAVEEIAASLRGEEPPVASTERVLDVGKRMIADQNAGSLPADIRINRGFEDTGVPTDQGIAGGFRNAEVNRMLAMEQGVSPHASGPVLGEAVMSDAGYGYYDPEGSFHLANERDNVILKDPASGRLAVLTRTPDMDEGAMLGLARTFLSGIAAGAPTRLAGAGPAAAAAAKPIPGAAQAAAAAPSAAQTVQAFDRQLVDPSWVTATEGRGPKVMAQMLRNTPMGGAIQRGIKGSTAQAGAAADRIAGTLTDVGDVKTAGSRLRVGADEFVKSVVPKRQNELYSKVTAAIDPAARSALINTQKTLGEIEAQFQNKAVQEFVTDSNFSELATTIRSAADEGLTFDDLRQMRTAVRALKPSQNTKVGINKTLVNRVYDALTRDMNLLVRRSGGDKAFEALKRADQYTYNMMGADDAPVAVIEKMTGGHSDEQIYGSLRQWAGKTSGADVEKLGVVKKAVPKESWNAFVGTMIRQMGKPTPGGQQVADAVEWSPVTFMTEYERLAPQAKTLMFSETPILRRNWDDLLIVAGKLKEVEKLGNPSGSGSHMISAFLGSGTVPLLYIAPLTTLSTLGGGVVGSRILTNPKFVRWITGAYRTAALAQKQPPGRADMTWRAQLQSISSVAGNDAEVAAALTKFIDALRQSGQPEREEPDASTAAAPQNIAEPYPAPPR